MFLKDSTKPLAHRANTDAAGHWDARSAELYALTCELEGEGLSVSDAGRVACGLLDELLDAAEAWDRAAQAARERRAA